MMEPTGKPSSKTKRSPAVQGTASSGEKPRRVSRGVRHAHTGTGRDKGITREQTGTAKAAPAPGRRRDEKQPPHKTVSRPGRSSTPEERIAYYKKKYGENFTSRIPEAPPPANQQKPKRKKSLLKKIRDFLKK
jgi:hypothetical protein